MISVSQVHISFGDAPLLEGADLQIQSGERVCLVGRNGTGKSTLLKLLAGEIEPDRGTITGRKLITSAYLPQAVPPGTGETVFEMVATGTGSIGYALNRYRQLTGLTSPENRPGNDPEVEKLAHRLEASGGWECQHRVEKILSTLFLEPEAAFGDLSAGLKRRVLLARTLVDSPDLLLLDEPTNHMDIPSIQLIEKILLKIPATLVFVSHDRRFTRHLASRIVELDRGELRDWGCGYAAFLKRRNSFLDAEMERLQKLLIPMQRAG